MSWISIHALREEGDTSAARDMGDSMEISIHALREEGDRITGGRKRSSSKFLSTPSARRATPVYAGGHQPGAISIHALREEGDTLYHKSSLTMRDFYPRPPRGGRHDRAAGGYELQPISIHALREEGDTQHCKIREPAPKFLSTPSARRAT